MRPTLLLFACLALCACGSTLRIRGTAPASGCVVNIVDESGRIQNSFRVAGPFTEETVVGGPLLTLRIDVIAECSGEVVKTVKSIDPGSKDANVVDLGTLRAIE